jgi:uncharacterized damage-inducible protein DinB
MDLLDRMLGYDHWATTRVLDYCAGLTDAQLDQPFDIGQRTLRETLHHMIYVIDGWTAQMIGGELPPPRGDRPALAELREQHDRYHPAFAAAARRAVDEGRLADVFRDHHRFPQSVGSTILQVLWHNVQHRSEARHILERLGVEKLWDLDPQEWEHEAGYVPSDIGQEDA